MELKQIFADFKVFYYQTFKTDEATNSVWPANDLCVHQLFLFEYDPVAYKSKFIGDR
jgi:hypothetical protein